MVVMVGSAVTSVSAIDCSLPVPQFLIQKGARMDSVSCDVSESCCHGWQDAEQVVLKAKGQGYGQGKGIGKQGKGQLMQDLVGTCDRQDQVALYKCATTTLPKLVPQGKGGKTRAMIQAKGCAHLAVSAGTDGAGTCKIDKGHGKGFEIDGVSTGCCDRANAYGATQSQCFPGSLQHDGECGMIGACGKKDQLSVLKFANAMMGKGKGKGSGSPPAAELLETFNMKNSGAQQMMASFMTSEVEEDASTEDASTEDASAEDGATEDRATDATGSHVVTGLLSFAAGAAVTGLGVTVLRRKTPSQDMYNEIVA
jgi:hypothetical protein